MELLLERKETNRDFTLGNLFIDGKFYCNILEDPIRDINKNGTFDCGEFKIKGHTAIPYGTYEVEVTYSPKFKRNLPILKNVKHFEGIRIHRGNSVDDTEGCLIPGQEYGEGRVINSTRCELELTSMIEKCNLKKEKVTIKII